MTTIHRILSEPPTIQARITVDQYHQMIEQHILKEDTSIELLDGLLVHKDRAARGESPMTIGTLHSLVVNRLAALNRKVDGFGCFIQTQQPIALPPVDEPEPDAAVVIGLPDDYRMVKPTSADVLAVIEVADSSLTRDRTAKLRIYAKGGINLYLIINIAEGCIEQYTQPISATGRYGHTETLTSKQSLFLPLPKRKSLKLSVASLLP